MTLPNDPLATSWLLTLIALSTLLVIIPIFRAMLAGLIYAIGALTGRDHLRATASRVMPRLGHLIGGLVVGSAAIAAPAFAATPSEVASLSLDWDATTVASTTSPTPDAMAVEARTRHSPADTAVPDLDRATPAPVQDTTSTTPARPATASAGATTSSHAVAPAQKPYVVRTGDTLWDIAEAHLPQARTSEITAAWKAIWKANEAVIGEEPGLIHPGQQLDLGVLA